MYRLVTFAISILLLFSFFHHAIAQELPITESSPSFQAQHYLIFSENIKKIVENHLGVRYRRGGSSKKGVDCSGFIRLVFRNLYGIDLPYMAATQYTMPIFKEIAFGDLKTGDLIFFSPTTKRRRINHVGIYLADGHFAHALEKHGVIISSLNNRHWKSRIFSTKRFDNQEPLGIKPALHTRITTHTSTRNN